MDSSSVLAAGVSGVAMYLLAVIVGPKYKEGDNEMMLLLSQARNYPVHSGILVAALCLLGLWISAVLLKVAENNI